MKRTIESRAALALAATCLAIAIVSTANANLVTDGGFENPVNVGNTSQNAYTIYGAGSMGAWTVGAVGGNNPGIYSDITGSGIFPGANVTEGHQAFDLGISGYATGNSISQVLPTVAGQTYQLSFDWGSEYAQALTAYVTVGNLNQALTDPARGGPNDGLPWIVHSSTFTFVANGNDTLTFGERQSNNSDFYGLALDNISVVPEPATFTLLLLPMVAAALRRSRKNRVAND